MIYYKANVGTYPLVQRAASKPETDYVLCCGPPYDLTNNPILKVFRDSTHDKLEY